VDKRLRSVTAPNVLHHQTPSAFTANSWLRSAAVLLVIGAVIIGVAWLEWSIERLLGVATRSSLEVGPVARQVGYLRHEKAALTRRRFHRNSLIYLEVHRDSNPGSAD
jgi:hypothetical protein